MVDLPFRLSHWRKRWRWAVLPSFFAIPGLTIIACRDGIWKSTVQIAHTLDVEKRVWKPLWRQCDRPRADRWGAQRAPDPVRRAQRPIRWSPDLRRPDAIRTRGSRCVSAATGKDAAMLEAAAAVALGAECGGDIQARRTSDQHCRARRQRGRAVSAAISTGWRQWSMLSNRQPTHVLRCDFQQQ